MAMPRTDVHQQRIRRLLWRRKAHLGVNLFTNQVLDHSSGCLGIDGSGHRHAQFLCFFGFVNKNPIISKKFQIFIYEIDQTCQQRAVLPLERQQKILAQLNETGNLRTMEIAALLNVTDETVRKDFEALEKRGYLIRVHGGATRPLKIREEISLTERQLTNRDEKTAIAREAAKRIQPNETIFLDASSTALTLTEFLPDYPLTILTNALNVFTALEGRSNLDLICTGGLYDARSRSYIGLIAEQSLRRFNIHRMFFSGSGLHLTRGISETNNRQAVFKERVVACAEDVVFLSDHTKLGQKAAFFFAQLSDITCIITDSQADQKILSDIASHGVEVIEA
jgi:DeoR/GlpR family transcriptional regulator of sugar metabolism